MEQRDETAMATDEELRQRLARLRLETEIESFEFLLRRVRTFNEWIVHQDSRMVDSNYSDDTLRYVSVLFGNWEGD